MGKTRIALQVLATGACYYAATRIAWLLTFPDSKVSLFFPPHAVAVAILLLVPTRHWWAYTLAAASSHFVATQQANWPVPYALHAEMFDAVQNLVAAGGVRLFIKSPFHRINLREAIVFIMNVGVLGPAVTSLWGAAITVFHGFGRDFWLEWRNLSISNAVTAMVLIPAFLMGAHKLSSRDFHAAPRRILEGSLLGASIITVGWVLFHTLPSGPDSSAALLYAPLPLFIWAALRFGVGGMSAATVTFASLAIIGTMQGQGPFVTRTPSENATALQFFLLLTAIPLLLLAVAIDVERRSKEALQLSEERVHLAERSAQLAIWEWNTDNDSVWLTDEGRAFFGFAPDEPVLVSKFNDRVHPEDSAVRAAALKNAVETHGSYEAEFRIILPDGSVRWIVARGRPGPPSSDAPRRIIGVSVDITTRKQIAAEAQLQREELTYLSRVATVSALSGSLAHELSQPLSMILHNAEVGERFASQEKPDIEVLRAIFADIVAADLHAGEIIERLRSMLRRGEVTLHPVNVNECVEELLRLTRTDLIERGVSVSRLTTSDLPRARTDRVQLQQVLLNLIMNACDAMATIPQEDRALTLTTSVTRNEVRIGVLDCGVGLPEDTEMLFRPFYTTKGSGLGMGLSICRTLVNSQGGSLWAERRADRGAAFFVALPIAMDDPLPLYTPKFQEPSRVTSRGRVASTKPTGEVTHGDAPTAESG